jgi:tetratricopeptide (TPR) repeat protein
MVLEADNKKTAQSEEVKVFKKIIATTDKASWKQQGLKMYARGYFDQAMKCFERSANLELYKKAEANKFADDATKKLIEIESERNAIKQNAHTYENMRSSDLSKLKKELKHE